MAKQTFLHSPVNINVPVLSMRFEDHLPASCGRSWWEDPQRWCHLRLKTDFFQHCRGPEPQALNDMRALKRAISNFRARSRRVVELQGKEYKKKKATLPVAAATAVVFCCLPPLFSRCGHCTLKQNKRVGDASYRNDGACVGADRQVESPEWFLLPPPHRGAVTHVRR